MDLKEVLSNLAEAGGLLVFAGGLVMLILRERIKATLGHIVAGQLQEQRAALERDLESYRVRLLSDIEHIKANQQIKTALALKVAEHKFAALERLNAALSGVTIHVLAAAGYRPTLKSKATCADAFKRVTALEAAFYGADMYFEVDTNRDHLQLVHRLVMLLPLCTPGNTETVSSDDEDAILALDRRVQDQVRTMIKALLDMAER